MSNRQFMTALAIVAVAAGCSTQKPPHTTESVSDQTNSNATSAVVDEPAPSVPPTQERSIAFGHMVPTVLVDGVNIFAGAHFVVVRATCTPNLAIDFTGSFGDANDVASIRGVGIMISLEPINHKSVPVQVTGADGREFISGATVPLYVNNISDDEAYEMARQLKISGPDGNNWYSASGAVVDKSNGTRHQFEANVECTEYFEPPG